MVEKELFLSQIFKTEILIDLYFMRTPESENHTFSIWSVCMCVSLCVCVCVSECFFFSITQKQTTAETSNLLFYICIIYRCYLKLFMKIGQKLCVQGHTKGFYYTKAYGRNFVLVNFRILKLR